MRTTWTELLERFVDNRLIEAAELSAVYAGTGLKPIEQLAPGAIVECRSLPELPLAAARLAAVVDETRSEADHVVGALDLIEAVGDAGETVDPQLRKWAALLGGMADAACLLIRQGLKPKLLPIPPCSLSSEEIERQLRAAVEKTTR